MELKNFIQYQQRLKAMVYLFLHSILSKHGEIFTIEEEQAQEFGNFYFDVLMWTN
jgi:hypothetical protein